MSLIRLLLQVIEEAQSRVFGDVLRDEREWLGDLFPLHVDEPVLAG